MHKHTGRLSRHRRTWHFWAGVHGCAVLGGDRPARPGWPGPCAVSGGDRGSRIWSGAV